jgi:hypothetical protein
MNLQWLGCVTRGSRNIALVIHTDDVVIWFTYGEDPRVTSAARRGNLALAMNTDDVVIWFTYGEDLGHLSLSPMVIHLR